MAEALATASATSRHHPRQVAVIDASECIGCTLCIKACPVDAIIGARTFLHAVVEPECVGCKLCVSPCPTDCIEMVDAQVKVSAREQAKLARERRKHRQKRLAARAQRDADLMTSQREALKKIIAKRTAAR